MHVCKYCQEDSQELPALLNYLRFGDMDMENYIFDGKLVLRAFDVPEEMCQDDDDFSSELEINFCPICGRDLRK